LNYARLHLMTTWEIALYRVSENAPPMKDRFRPFSAIFHQGLEVLGCVHQTGNIVGPATGAYGLLDGGTLRSFNGEFFMIFTTPALLDCILHRTLESLNHPVVIPFRDDPARILAHLFLQILVS
jgi:hypothetical protein